MYFINLFIYMQSELFYLYITTESNLLVQYILRGFCKHSFKLDGKLNWQLQNANRSTNIYWCRPSSNTNILSRPVSKTLTLCDMRKNKNANWTILAFFNERRSNDLGGLITKTVLFEDVLVYNSQKSRTLLLSAYRIYMTVFAYNRRWGTYS